MLAPLRGVARSSGMKINSPSPSLVGGIWNVQQKIILYK